MENLFAKDKLYHFIVCLLASLIHPLFALGLALGKEYGDSKAVGNHWCWADLGADFCGMLVGGILWICIKSLLNS